MEKSSLESLPIIFNNDYFSWERRYDDKTGIFRFSQNRPHYSGWRDRNESHGGRHAGLSLPGKLGAGESPGTVGSATALCGGGE